MRYTTSIEDAVDRFYDEDGAAVEICGGMRLMIKSRFCPWCGARMDEEADE